MKTAALKVPILPHTCPEAPQPPSIKTPLYPHQLRALHRCLLIENDGSLGTEFGCTHDYKSRGGVLADAVGMGKTATTIGLILSTPREPNEGDTLVVAPGHLIPQWKKEIEKFAGDSIEVVVGRAGLQRNPTFHSMAKTHRVVLVDVESVLTDEQEKFYYHWGWSRNSRCTRGLDKQTIETYKKAALFCVKSPRGPCSYEGMVYTGILHMPPRPWRRVVFDEIQDLVIEGAKSQKNLLQLSRTAKNVWLLTATPFPQGNTSAYANHELLGFCRLRLDVEVTYNLHSSHPFEIIKRKLYIRSPKHVADDAVSASKTVTRETVDVRATELESKFYQLEKEDIVSSDPFDAQYDSLRQMMVHPEASKRLREEIVGRDAAAQQQVGRFHSVASFARSSLATARSRLSDVTNKLIPNSELDIKVNRFSLNLALKIRQVRNEPLQANPFATAATATSQTINTSLEAREADAIRSFYQDNDSRVHFMTLGRSDLGGRAAEIIKGHNSIQRIVDYFNREMSHGKKIPWGGGSSAEYIDCFISTKERLRTLYDNKLSEYQLEKTQLQRRIQTLEVTISTSGKQGAQSQEEAMKSRNGSKTATLIEFLRRVEQKEEQTIVFSYWHDTLRLVFKSLKRNGCQVSFCDGSSHMMSKALTDFTSGVTSILLLSGKAKASGANLQCASNVVILDPPGSSGEHGATLENQAIGRAVRMGQEKPVTVARFCVKHSVEEQLFQRIDVATESLVLRASDNSYACEAANKKLKPGLLKPAPRDDEDIEIGETLSVAALAKQRVVEAQRTNTIIELLDSDNEDDNGDTQMNQTKPVARVESLKIPEEGCLLKEGMATDSINVLKRPANEGVSGKRPKVARVSLDPTEKVPDTNELTCTDKDTGRHPLFDSEREEYSKALGGQQLNGHQIKWLDKLSQLKATKARTGIAWEQDCRSCLGKWCRLQRTSYQIHMKGTKPMPEIRIKLLEDIDFPWSNNELASKRLAVYQSADAGPDTLQELLKTCDLSIHLAKFKEAGVVSAAELKAKLQDFAFMGSLVDKIGLSGPESIKLTICASEFKC